MQPKQHKADRLAAQRGTAREMSQQHFALGETPNTPINAGVTVESVSLIFRTLLDASITEFPTATLGQRLKYERIRLGRSVNFMAAASMHTRHAISNAENRCAMPGAQMLSAYAEQGADIQYVLTGRRTFTQAHCLEMLNRAFSLANAQESSK